jgi:octaheme c-type cytochrome (tetrathionate reductase family)
MKRGMQGLAVLIMTQVMGMTGVHGISEKGREAHEKIAGPFAAPQEVTRTCLQCHKEQADDLLHSRHWNWLGESFEHNGDTVQLGKKNMFNNFCVSISSNEPRCTSCHIGYGWEDASFDFTKQENMDCMVCHDTTGTYKKYPTDAGYPVYKEEEKVFDGKKVYPRVDLLEVAQNVANPRIENCGACHFTGGGGHGVKHGDLDYSLAERNPKIDIHMGHPDPEKRMDCNVCHASPDKHDIRGALHASMAADQNRLTCQECHKGEAPHTQRMKNTLNRHALSMACTTCHVPVVAEKHPTKTWWDWTTAGDRERPVEMDENGMPLYSWKKGDFAWEKDLVPEYYWYDGTTGIYFPGDKIPEGTKILNLNPLNGDYRAAGAKIAPFKVMRGKQYYDTESGELLIPHLFGKGGYWKERDWDAAFRDGMASAGKTFSGSYAAIETEMYWPIHHMVKPASMAVSCSECHPKDGSPSRMNWEALGYPGDPVKTANSRILDQIVEWNP